MSEAAPVDSRRAEEEFDELESAFRVLQEGTIRLAEATPRPARRVDLAKLAREAEEAKGSQHPDESN